MVRSRVNEVSKTGLPIAGIILAVFFFLVGPVVPGGAQEPVGEGLESRGVRWYSDLAAGNRVAAQTGRPLLIVFR